MILVTGAGGNIGSELVRRLASAGAPARAAYHSPAKAAKARAEGGDTALLDYGDAGTVCEALRGVETLFLLCPSSPSLPEVEKGVVAEAVRAGVKRIVKLSVWRASEESFIFARWHRQSEKQIEACGIPWTFLRPNSFMQNLSNFFAGSIRSAGAFHLPAGQARVSHIDTRDVAAVAAKVLTEEGHAGRAYDLSGPEALSYHQIANTLSVVLDRKVTYTSVADADFKKSMTGAGAPEWLADAMIDLQHHSLQGQAADVLAAVQQLTGRRPLFFEQFARDHAAAFR